MSKADRETKAGGHSARTCRNCRVGALVPRRSTYARWHGEHFVVLPNVLAWRCDFCGESQDSGTKPNMIVTEERPQSYINWKTEEVNGKKKKVRIDSTGWEIVLEKKACKECAEKQIEVLELPDE